MKKVLFSILVLLQFAEVSRAQVLNLSTNTSNWVCRQQSGLNFSAPTFSQANSGTWVPAVGGNVSGWPSNCTTPPRDLSNFFPITTPGNTVCGNGGTQFTAFFKRNFTLPCQDICAATAVVVCDDYFRMWVDGQLIPASAVTSTNPNTDGDAYCFGTLIAENVTGDSRFYQYTVNFAPFVNTTVANHTIIFELGNCQYAGYLAANITVEAVPNPGINFERNCPNELILWGMPGTPNQTWQVFTSSSATGPWTMIDTHVDSNEKAAKFQHSVTIPSGLFIRIVHSINFLCFGQMQTVSAELILQPCTGFIGGNDRSDTHLSNEIEVYPNPATDFIQIKINSNLVQTVALVNCLGQTVAQIEVGQLEEQLDTSGYSDGFYLLKAIGSDGKLLDQKKIILQGN